LRASIGEIGDTSPAIAAKLVKIASP